MFYGAPNEELGGDILNNHYPNFTVMHVFEHNVSILFNRISKIHITNHMI